MHLGDYDAFQAFRFLDGKNMRTCGEGLNEVERGVRMAICEVCINMMNHF